MIFCPVIDGSDFWVRRSLKTPELRAQNFLIIVGLKVKYDRRNLQQLVAKTSLSMNVPLKSF